MTRVINDDHLHNPSHHFINDQVPVTEGPSLLKFKVGRPNSLEKMRGGNGQFMTSNLRIWIKLPSLSHRIYFTLSVLSFCGNHKLSIIFCIWGVHLLKIRRNACPWCTLIVPKYVTSLTTGS